jgi:hypothetical protein
MIYNTGWVGKKCRLSQVISKFGLQFFPHPLEPQVGQRHFSASIIIFLDFFNSKSEVSRNLANVFVDYLRIDSRINHRMTSGCWR